MTHIDIDTLAMIAVGEVRPDDAQQAHLTSCSACREELAELTRTVTVARSAHGRELIVPPGDVWKRIRTELAFDADEGPVDIPVGDTTADRGLPQHPHRQHRRQRPRRAWPRPGIPLAAACLVAGLVAGVGGGIWWQSGRQPEGSVTSTVLAEARLDPFPGWADARGAAVVEEQSDGRRRVVVDVDSASTSGASGAGLREVWLIRTDGAGLVSIGLLDGATGSFVIPADIDVTQYAVVDVSAEPDDGDPAHSGDSILRGTLVES